MTKQAAILAGGKGTRLLPLTLNVPKPMVEVAGKPFLHWQIKYLQQQGITELVLLIAHLAEQVKEYFKAHPVPGIDIKYSVEPEPLGTGGALHHASSLLREQFWLLNGDSFLRVDLPAMAAYSAPYTWDVCMAKTPAKLVSAPGNLRTEDGVVTGYEKQATDESGYADIDAGVYLFSKSVVEHGPQGQFDLGAYWPDLISRRALGAFEITERFYDIGTLERLKTFEQFVLRDLARS